MRLSDDFDLSKPFFGIRAENKSADIFIYDVIGEDWLGGMSAKRFADELKDAGEVDTLNVFINSPGGDVFAGFAISEQLKRHSARKVVHIDGLAASIASLIAMSGDEIVMADNSMMMIHNAWTVSAGNASDMRETAGVLDKIDKQLVSAYAERTGQKSADIVDWMGAETWMDADEAVERGFADRRSEAKRVAAFAFDLSKMGFKHTPKLEAATLAVKEPSIRDRIADLDLFRRQRQHARK